MALVLPIVLQEFLILASKVTFKDVKGLRAALPAGVVEVEYRAARDLAVAAATLVGGNRLGEIAVAQLSSISSVSVVPD